ncbi:MAG: AtpZ/AtpI family protein [Candidatus Limnocylindrus sp.]|jgi:F0F1-type ATP synthase assembly protein I
MSTPDSAPQNEREIGDPRLESPQIPDEVVGLMSDMGKGAYLALFSQIGITLLIANLGGALLGHWVDGQLNSEPIFLVLGFIGGFGAGAVGAARLVQRTLRRLDALDAAAKAAKREREAKERDAARLRGRVE